MPYVQATLASASASTAAVLHHFERVCVLLLLLLVSSEGSLISDALPISLAIHLFSSLPSLRSGTEAQDTAVRPAANTPARRTQAQQVARDSRDVQRAPGRPAPDVSKLRITDKPLPPPPSTTPSLQPQLPQPKSMQGVQRRADAEVDADTLRANSFIGSLREDGSVGSWLDVGESYSRPESLVDDAHANLFNLDDYLSRPTPTSPSPQPSTTTERPARRSRAPTPPNSLPFNPRMSESLEFFGNLPKAPAESAMAHAKPALIQTDATLLAKSSLVLSRPAESEVVYDPPTANPRTSGLPDPSNFPDPYPHGMSYHHPTSTTPALSYAGSSTASTRSSAYTNPGSTFSISGFSGDFSHVRVASGDDIDGAIGLGFGTAGIGGSHGTDSIVEILSRASNGSSLSSGSHKSHGHVHIPPIPMSRVRRADYPRAARTPSQSEDLAPLPAAHERPELPHPLRTQPSYDTSWQCDHDDFGTSEDEYDYGDQQDGDEEEDEKGEEPGSAIVVAEEGRGLIVRGEGLSVHSLTIQPGITHLLVGGSSTPNSIPAFLTATLPQINTTLLVLDISANFLASLSPALALCSSLEELNISANPLRALPEFLADLTSLRLLIADCTGISTIPAPLLALQKLHTLSIRRNKMHALPSWLCTLPCLESLLVDGNPFQGPWKALVEPLLAKAPMTPAYPPSTPLLPQLSASFSISSNTTTGDTTDVSEDLTDQDEATAPTTSSSYLHISGLAPGDADLEEDTITPAHARLLERSATAPAPYVASHAQPHATSLSRTRTTPNRSFYDRERQQRDQLGAVVSPTIIEDEDKLNSTGMLTTPADATPGSPNLAAARGELRRMHSADELGRAMQPLRIPTLLRKTRRFATLNLHARGPSRGSIRPALVHSLWGEPSPEEEDDADVESPPRFHSRARAATNVSRRERSSRDEEYEQSVRQSLAKQKGEKEKGGRKWGFLKKMSMGKLRPMDSATPPPSRPSTSHGMGTASSSSASVRPATVLASANSSQVVHPQLEVNTLNASNTSPSPFVGSQPPPSFSLQQSPLPQNSSTDKLRVSPTATTPSSAGFLAPPSPMSKSSKRRSFLPLDGPPALYIPIPNTAPFLGGLTASNGVGDLDLRQVSPILDSPQDALRKEEDRNREANSRALRSVMAYLKDMNDLTLLSQGSVLSMYGGSVPLMERSRRPTLVDGGRLQSETSIDSMDSASSAPTTASSHLRSLDSLRGDRSGSLNTMSIATTDSSGSSGEERKCKDDRGKRVMVVREIVETERTYVKNLQDLVDIYVRPASVSVSSIGSVTSSNKDTVVPAAERKVVFGGLEALFIFHKKSFLPALEAAAAPLFTPQGSAVDADSGGKLSSDVAINFENSVSRIRQWVTDRPAPAPPSATLSPSSSTAHLANMAISMSAISAPSSSLVDGMSAGKTLLTSGQRKRIKAYLKRCRINPRHSQLNLEGYLLLPVQRIPRYRLLVCPVLSLEDLTRCTPPPSDSFDDPLDRALTEISSLATNMNEGKREAESRRKLVQWQSRIRGKFPSPLVQPHRRLIMDGKLLLTRIVRKQTMAFEVLDSHGDTSSVAVDCLAPELTPRPLYGVLCNDLFVLCRDPSYGKDANSPVDLWAVLRMQTMPQPTSIVHGNTLRIVDTKAILYLEAPSTSEALTWFRG
ncbi:hypothetical protein EW145_g1259 [Phellinidium pouzarii]|uniref:DH domain-containing protein n=1 Tax=Phellinidium pouzarii TaxID=167371 RepID=A0A4S4LF69_9AGAM|nr:hypothetical protein EW145_g1259 [Phellinidium pouzarii]